MDGKIDPQQKEKGQSLVMLLLLMFAFFVILALVIDGGNTYFQRRNAQNAADAGALAGARDYCEFKDSLRASGVAASYVTSNEAGLFEPVTINASQGTVNVKTLITYDTFVGNVINQSNITAVAEAEAGCQQPCLGEGVLPVVWICNEDGVVTPGEIDCENLPIDDDTLSDYLTVPPPGEVGCIPVSLRAGKTGYNCPHLTIVMDNIDIEKYQCDTFGGPIDCDFDGDGKDDYVSAENSGWADLDGDDSTYDCRPPNNEGVDELNHWITDGYECPFYIDTWVGDQAAPSVKIFKEVEKRRVTNPIVILPIFDESCPSNPDPTGAGYVASDGCIWHDGAGEHPPDDVVHTFSKKNSNYYHIERLSVFYITCVQEQKGDCPGATAFYDKNKTEIIKTLKEGADYNAIEGYFLRGYIPGLKGDCGYDPDLDVFSVYLDK